MSVLKIDSLIKKAPLKKLMPRFNNNDSEVSFVSIGKKPFLIAYNSQDNEEYCLLWPSIMMGYTVYCNIKDFLYDVEKTLIGDDYTLIEDNLDSVHFNYSVPKILDLQDGEVSISGKKSYLAKMSLNQYKNNGFLVSDYSRDIKNNDYSFLKLELNKRKKNGIKDKDFHEPLIEEKEDCVYLSWSRIIPFSPVFFLSINHKYDLNKKIAELVQGTYHTSVVPKRNFPSISDLEGTVSNLINNLS